MFSNLSLSSISFASDTPCLVIVGAPKLRSRTTVRPLGPRVTLTAFERILPPFTILLRTFSPKRTSLAAMVECSDAIRLIRLGYDADYVVFTHMQQVLVFQLEFLARVFAEEDAFADLDPHGDHFAVVVGLAGAAGHDFTDRRLFRGGVWNDDAAGRFALLFEPRDDNAIVEGTKLHISTSLLDFASVTRPINFGARDCQRS